MSSTHPLLFIPDLQFRAPSLQRANPDSHEILTNMTEGYLVTDGVGTIQEANFAATALLQTSLTSLRGKSILRYLGRESRTRFLSLLRRLRPSEGAQAWEVLIQPQQGPSARATLTVIASQDLTGKFFTLHCHLTNVSSQFQSTLLLEHHRGVRASLEEATRVTLCTHDLNGTLLFVGHQVASVLGYQANQMIGQNLAEFLIPSEQHLFSRYLQLVQHGQPHEGSLRLSTKTGEECIFPYRNARYEVAGHPLYIHLYANDMHHRRLPSREGREHRIREHAAELTKINAALQKEVADCKRAEQGFQDAHEELERRVAARTVELSQANLLLEQEILERRQAQEALRDSEARYRLLSASAPIGIAQTDANGDIVYTNAYWQALAGLNADETLGSRWLQAVHPDDRTSVATGWASAIRSGCEFSYEWRFVRPNGDECWVLARATPLHTSDGHLTGYVSTLEDVTSQKKSQAVLQEEAQISRGQTIALARTLKALTAEPALDSFLSQVLTAITQQLKVYRACLWLSGESQECLSPHMTFENGTITLLSHDSASFSLVTDETRFWPDLVQTQRPILITDLEHEPRLPTGIALFSQGIRSLLLVPLVLEDETTGWVSLQSTEVTSYRPEELELAQALAQQIALAMQLANFAERRRQAAILEERNRLAQEIHDTLAQGLTGIIIQLEAAKEVLATAPDGAYAHVDRAATLARESLTEARRSVRALHPQVLDHQELPTALEQLSTQLEAQTQIPIVFTLRGTPYPLSAEAAANLLRISQEAIINAWKHARPRTIFLNLGFDSHEVHLLVQDDGRGFDMLTSPPGSGFGLINMRERAERLGGHLTLTSTPGQGTQVAVKVPHTQLS